MKIPFQPIFLLWVAFSFGGCLVGEKIVYEVNVDKSHNSGTATVTYTNIRSDAANDKEFEEDKKNLFEYMYKSPQFIQQMKGEGKEVIKRELFPDEKKNLTGRAVYKFRKLSDVENLAYEDGFYFLTLALDDSVISTNGEVIKSSNYKRILWDDSHTTLKFEIMIESSQAVSKLRPMAPYFKP